MTKVAYLFGAGIAHAETTLAGYDIGVLTTEITEGIQNQLVAAGEAMNVLVGDDLLTKGVDVEQLISLYESTGTAKDNKAALFLRNSFMKEVSGRLGKVDQGKKRFQPMLMTSMFEMHQRHGTDLQEVISGVLSLNYDDFAERALGAVYDSFNYGFSITAMENVPIGYKLGDGLTLLKLHGSFNWSNDFPPTIVNGQRDDADQCLWIPPGVEKKKEKYPFNVLWGKAKEILDCDVLRVIGCSLSRNDWQLISLLHAAKRVRGFRIEYVDYEDKGKQKADEYPYLGIVRILSLEGFRKHLADETGLQESSKEIEEFASWENRLRFNCLQEWVKFRKVALEAALGERAMELSNSQFIKQI